MLKAIKVLFISTVLMMAVSCNEDPASTPIIGAKTQFDQNIITSSQSDLDVISNWESGTTRGNEFWKIRRVTN